MRPDDGPAQTAVEVGGVTLPLELKVALPDPGQCDASDVASPAVQSAPMAPSPVTPDSQNRQSTLLRRRTAFDENAWTTLTDKPASAAASRLHQPALLRGLKAAAEAVGWLPSAMAEVVGRTAYRSCLRRASATWRSPDQLVLGDTVLKLRTRSHRARVLSRFNSAVGDL